MRLTVIVSFLLLTFCIAPFSADAAFFVRHSVSAAPATDDNTGSVAAVATNRHSHSFFRRLPGNKRWYRHYGKQNNHSAFGIFSLVCVGISIVFAWGVMTWGLGALAAVASVGFAVGAIVLAAFGIRKDRKPGYAMAGMGFGIAAGILFTLSALFLLAWGAL